MLQFGQKNRKSRSIFVNILTIMLIVLIVQTSFFIVGVSVGGAYENLDNTSLQNFNNHVINRVDLLERDILERWTNITDIYQKVTDGVETTVKNKLQNGDYDDTKQAYTNLLNNEREISVEVINAISNDLFQTLTSKSVTGAFVFFGDANENTDKYGLYFRDNNPFLYYVDNRDCVVEVAPFDYNNDKKIINGSDYNTKLLYSQFNESKKKFFTNPIDIITEHPFIGVENCGWMSTPFYLNNTRTEVVTYSLPLVMQLQKGDQTENIVIGIIGIDISLKNIMSLLPHTELAGENNGYYVLSRTLPSNNEYQYNILENESIISGINNDQINQFFGVNRDQFLNITDNEYYSDIYRATLNDDQKFYISYKEVRIYTSNHPYESEKWYIIGFVDYDVIHNYSTNLRRTIYLTILISLLINVVFIALLSYSMTKPIVDLTNRIKHSSSSEILMLDRLNIREIDDLILAIQVLSEGMLEAETKLSKIVDLVEMPMIAFEYDFFSNTVYTSKDISIILKIDDKNHYTINEFLSLFEYLKPYIVHQVDRTTTYKYLDITGHYRWIDVRFIESENQNETAGIILDVTNEYLEKENIIRERDYDSLTNIFNRRAFQANLYQLFESTSHLKKGAFVMLDLDNLKFINDTYGHDYGDQYIKEMGNIISSVCNENDNCLYGRRSGDEFYIFFYGYDEISDINRDINRLQNAVANSQVPSPSGTTLRIRVSGGISYYPDDSNNPDDLMKYADYAMYEAKNLLKGEFKTFDLDSYQKNSYILKNKEELNILIENELVDFHFQPVVSVKDGKIIGYESLMRSMMPAFRGPDEILNVAKAQSKLNKIESLTFLKTLEKYRKYSNLFGDTKIFINSIASQVLSYGDIKIISEKYHDVLHRIVVEFTEHEKDSGNLREQKIRVIKKWNCQIALDDYGTGYNSEVMLLQTQCDYIKIDMSLIRNVHLDQDRQQMVNNIVTYARQKGITCIAEGVEYFEELEFLVSIDCDYVQGYYFSKPEPFPKQIDYEKINIINQLQAKYWPNNKKGK